METFEFKSLSEFNLWKEKIELDTCSSYVKKSGAVRRPNGDLLLYYNCNRSGKYTPSGKGIRRIKSKQSSKIGSKCASNMRVKITNGGGQVIVKYSNHHDNHNLQMEHLRLPLSVRALIASQLKDGVSVHQIMNAIRDVSSKTNMNRISLIKGRDIQNIKRDFKVDKKIEKQNLDATSLKLWIKDMIKKKPVDQKLPSCKESSIQNLTGHINVVNNSSSDLEMVASHVCDETFCCPISKAQTFIELYKTCKYRIGEVENKKLDENLNILIDICSKSSNNSSTSYIDSFQTTYLSRVREEKQEEPLVLFQEKKVTMNSSRLCNEKINKNVTEELFELEQVFEESKFYENLVTQDFAELDDDILDEVLNIHTEFDHSYF